MENPTHTEYKTNATLKDIAEALNISISTVSRALKEHPRISLSTQQRVKKTAELMGYVSIDMLEMQKRKQSNLIGVIVPKISYHLYAMAISGIERIAEEHGMHIIVCQSNESYEREKSLVQELIHVGVNGVIAFLARLNSFHMLVNFPFSQEMFPYEAFLLGRQN